MPNIAIHRTPNRLRETKILASRESTPTEFGPTMVTKTMLTFDHHRAVLRLIGCNTEKNLEDIRRVLLATSGDEIHATDEEFCVIEFDDVLWVLPFSIPNVGDFLASLQKRYSGFQICFRAHFDALPWRWRKRWLGILPLPEPQLGEFPLRTMRSVVLSGPVSFADFEIPSMRRLNV